MSGYVILGAAASGRGSAAPAEPSPQPAPVRSEADARAIATSFLQSLVGVPYIWAGKDPAKGLDCSGAVTVAYEKAGLAKPGARYRFGSADLHRRLRPTSDPRPGDCVFYGSGKVSHVMLYLGSDKVVGATGGGPRTRTAADAAEIGAYVKVRPVNYRKDLIGYGRAPDPSDPLGGSAVPIVNNSDSREGLTAFGYAVALLATAATGYLAWRWKEGST